MKRILLSITAVACCVAGHAFAADPLPIYRPKVKLADICFHHPGAKPSLSVIKEQPEL
ncbi:MAG: hypothetical protein HZA91_10400 [Verrucomicrobia bacterium]|nr:hypothetical protein [Verrucomicrobiota bacterium]